MKKGYWIMAVLTTVITIIAFWPIGIGLAILLFYVIPKQKKKDRQDREELTAKLETAEINAELLDILLSVKKQKGKGDKTE